MPTSIRLLLSSILLSTLASAYWQPTPGTTWFIQLIQPIKSLSGISNFQAYDFDLFDNSASLISQIHGLPQGAKAICYFSAGSWEKWRPDAGEFKKEDLGAPLDGWPGERWLNISSPDVRSIMSARMDLAQQKGCDALDPDNVDGYQNKNGLGLTKAQAADYVQWLAAQGHSRGMAVGLKNAGGLIGSVLGDVQFQVNEQCVKYKECSVWQPFISANKAVFHIEYQKGNTVTEAQEKKVCDNPGAKGFSTIIKHLNLDSWYYACAPDSRKRSQGQESAAAPKARPWAAFRA